MKYLVILSLLVIFPITAFGYPYWWGQSSTNFTNPDNWSSPDFGSSAQLFISEGQATYMPVLSSGSVSVSSVNVGFGATTGGWYGNGTLGITGGALACSTLYVPAISSPHTGIVTQSNGNVNLSGELSIGGSDNSNGRYTISGGSLNLSGHLLLSDSPTSVGTLEIIGTGATSISASYQLKIRGGTGNLKFVLGAAGVTPIVTTRVFLSNDVYGDSVAANLIVDITNYALQNDVVLIDYSNGVFPESEGWFDSITIIGGLASVEKINNKLMLTNIVKTGTVLWIGNGATNDWSLAANWLGDIIPDLNAKATIGDGKSAVITQSGAQASDLLIGNSGSGRLDIQSGNLTVSQSLKVGQIQNALGRVVQSGGVVSTGLRLNIGDILNSIGEYTISGGSLNCGQQLLIGNAGTGEFTIEGSGATSITAGSLNSGSGSIKMKFKPDALGVTPLTVTNIGMGTAVSILSVDLRDYNDVNRDMVLIKYSGTRSGSFGTVNIYNGSANLVYDDSGRAVKLTNVTVVLPELPVVYNQKVDPATDPAANARKIMPVTWQDQGNMVLFPQFNFMNTWQVGGVYQINEEAYSGYLDWWTSGLPGSTMDPFDFESHLSPHAKFAYMPNYQVAVDQWKLRNSIVFEGSGPGGWCYDGFFVDYEEVGNWDFLSGVPDYVQDYVIGQIGNKFYGWSYGENDAGYTNAGAQYQPEVSTPKQAFDYFTGFNRRWFNCLQNYVSVLNNTTLTPYLACNSEVRKFGAQTPNQMYSIPIWASIMRGTSRQTGVLWSATIDSCHNALGGSKNYDMPGGENWGNSEELLRMSMYVYLMYGAQALAPPMPLHMADPNGSWRSVLSPLGEMTLEVRNLVRSKPNLGVMHRPIAFVWDFYAGWTPPRTYSITKTYVTWGSLPYEKGDFQIDAMFRMLYPHYEDAAFFSDERGYFTDTPYGDMVDVLLSNTPKYVLNKYDAAVVMGPTLIEGRLLETLQDFISRGGSVITTAAQLTEDSQSLFGVKLLDQTTTANSVNWTTGGSTSENAFTLHKLQVVDGSAEVIASTPSGDPAIVKLQSPAGGELIVFASDYGLTNFSGSLGSAGWEQTITSPYQLLNHVKTYLDNCFENQELLDIASNGIQYFVNVTDEEDKFFVTLCNNTNNIWTDSVSFKSTDIESCQDIITGTPYGSGSSVTVTVPAKDVVILEVQTASAAVTFKSTTPVPTPTAEELVLPGDEVIDKWDRLTPVAMIDSNNRPTALSAQSAEPAGALYVNQWLFDGMDNQQWVKNVKALGLTGVDLKATKLFDTDMQEIWSLLQANGLRVGAIHAAVDMAPFSFGNIASDNPTPDREPVLEWLELTMDLMHDAGITRLILYPGYRNGSMAAPFSSTHAVSSFQRLAAKAGTCGVKIIIEISRGQELYTSTAAVQGLVNTINSPNVSAGVNTANSSMRNENPITAINSIGGTNVEYVHLASFSGSENNGLIYYNSLQQGYVSINNMKTIYNARRAAGKATSIYLVEPEAPVDTLLSNLVALGVINITLPLSADIDNSGSVTLADLALICQYWLDSDCGSKDLCGGADLNIDNTVDLLDFAEYAVDYLSTNP